MPAIPVPVLINFLFTSFPFIIFPVIILHIIQVFSVKKKTIVISFPVNKTLRAAVIIPAVRISTHGKARSG
jgi:hypothetical protein